MGRRAVKRSSDVLPEKDERGGERLPAQKERPAKLHSLEGEAGVLRELREGLARQPPELPCKYLYDDRGSALFEQIMQLPEYFPTRTERALLKERARDLARGGLADVVELGSGAASKTIPVLEAALELGQRPRYLALDISAHALERTRQILAPLRGVNVEAVLADYTRPFLLPKKRRGAPRLVLFLGGTIGNEEDEGAIALLSRVREQVDPGDRLLLGANLVTDPAAIHAAYNDAQGVTAAFNRNVLRAVNALTRSKFDPDSFWHHAPYVVERRRIEMWLVAKEQLEVDLGRMGGTLRLARGSGIRTEISRRFTRDEVLRLIDAAGWTPEEWFESGDGRFGLALGVARGSRQGF